MDQGNLRADVNLSLSPKGSGVLGSSEHRRYFRIVLPSCPQPFAVERPSVLPRHIDLETAVASAARRTPTARASTTHPFPLPIMATEQKALLARLHAKPGKEDEVAAFLKSALPMAQAEDGTVKWYALQLDDTTFGIFDTFADDDGRQAHLDGDIAAALMEHADDLLAQPPQIEQVDVLAAK